MARAGFAWGGKGQQPQTIVGKVFASLFMGVFILVGLSFLTMMAGAILGDLAVYRWTQVQAEVKTSEIIEDRQRSRPYRLAVEYAYEVEGQPYISEQVYIDERWTDDHGEVARLRDEHASDQSVVAYFNPNDPSEAVLRRPDLSGLALAGVFTIIPLLFIAAGVYGIYQTWRAPGRSGKGAVSIGRTGEGRNFGRVIGLVLAGMFIVIGSILSLTLLVDPLMRSRAAQDWPTVEAEVIRSEVLTSDRGEGRTYAVGIEYEYEIDDQTYRGHRYDFTTGYTSGREGKQAIVDDHPLGRRIDVHVDPDDPYESVIEPDLALGLQWLVLLFPTVGLLILVAIIMVPRRDSAADIAGTADSPRNRAGAEVGARGSVDRGPRRLDRRESRIGGFIGLLGFAVIWNVIVIFAVIPNAPWWFAAIFAVVGVAVAAGAVYQGLRLFNPIVEMEIEPGHVQAGDTVRVRWHLRGNVSRLHDLAIRLEGWEEAEYRQGTRTTHDRETLATFNVVETQDLAEMERGESEVTVPANVMHTFKARSNRIIWVLHAEGSIKFWPNLNQSFELDIHPREVTHG